MEPRNGAVEAAIVVDSARDPAAGRRFDKFIRVSGVEILPVTPGQALLARQAYRDFGRGGGSRARLSLWDCFAYALAVDRREPLLSKGDDFGHTDVEVAELP